MSDNGASKLSVDSPEAFLDRELSWLAFARRVLAQVEDSELPLLERVKFAGIMGLLHDEFFMKRMSGIKRRLSKKSKKLSQSGRNAQEQLKSCCAEILAQMELIARVTQDDLLPALAAHGLGIREYADLSDVEQSRLREYFRVSVQPILTPLAVDNEHPFPFISSDALNLAVVIPSKKKGQERFIRIKVPGNRPRWVPLSDGAGFVPLEQVIARNLDLMFPSKPPTQVHLFRVTRGAEGEPDQSAELSGDELQAPGSIVRQVSAELKARRFAGVVRLQVTAGMPEGTRRWVCRQLGLSATDVYQTEALLGLRDLLSLDAGPRPDLQLESHQPVTHPRLRNLAPEDSTAMFDEIRRGDLLLHHPYDSFDTSVLRFLESAARDPDVLAIKLTIYRTSKGSPIVRALSEAARRGKQVAVLVEITARFDEAPNIAWGQQLENEGVHVAYGVEELKTHVKLALVVREEGGRLCRYAHVGTGNYHTGTARIYEDLGILTCDPEICDDVSVVFNQLTGATPPPTYKRLLVAPEAMRTRFTELIQREADHARAGRPSGIKAKLNQLQDPQIIGELYKAGRAGVPIELCVRGLCCLRPGLAGLSETIRVYSVVGRFLEHSRIYRFENAGDIEFFIGSADWMQRNLSKRVETIAPVLDADVRRQLDRIFSVYAQDNCSAWDCGPDGNYVRRTPSPGEPRRASQDTFISFARDSQQPVGTDPLPPVDPDALPVPIDDL